MDTPLVYLPHMSRLAGLTLETTVAALSVVTQPSATVVEGQPFATPPRIRVTDEHGNGIAGKRVYAIMYSANGYVLPNLYSKLRSVATARQSPNYDVNGAASSAASSLTMSCSAACNFE